MSEIDLFKKQLNIKSNVIKRLRKEMKVYQDELNEAKVNRDKLNELSEENDQNLNWKKKNADNILQESLKMVPDTENRLKSAEDDLSNMIVSNVYTCIYKYIIKKKIIIITINRTTQSMELKKKSEFVKIY